ncbi:MAG: group II intron maturase-specific domain-containing protein [Verrucomicrobiota bacterium]
MSTALAYLHEQGLVHRDIKPSNVVYVNGVAKLGEIRLVTDAGDTQSIVGTEPIAEVVEEANAVLRGWSGYFHFRNSTSVMGNLKRYSRDRLRRWLWPKHSCKGGLWSLMSGWILTMDCLAGHELLPRLGQRNIHAGNASG